MTATIYTQWRWGVEQGWGWKLLNKVLYGEALPVYIPFLTEFEVGRVRNKSSK